MYHIAIDTRKRILKLFKNATLIKQYPVAVGKPSTPTPLGYWRISNKSLWGEQFGGHFMQIDVPWGIYGIRGTDMPWSISHTVSLGCIRMNSRDAGDLYCIVPVCTTVHIY